MKVVGPFAFFDPVHRNKATLRFIDPKQGICPAEQ